MPPRLSDAAPLRVLRLAEALFGSVVDGMSGRELARATGYSPSNVSRDMRLLEAAGWARQAENGRWLLTERPVALTKIYNLHIADLAERTRGFDARASVLARQML